MREEALRLLSLGFSVIPVGADKRPLIPWKKFQTERMDPSEAHCFDKAHGIAIIAGEVSGNLECIDLDVKYDIDQSCEDFLQYVVSNTEGMIIQETPSGGYHIIYRTDHKPDGNTKIAGRSPIFGEDEKTKELFFIESRGEGGYFLVDPSPKYSIGDSNFKDITTIPWSKRCEMWEMAHTFNQVIEEKKIEQQINSNHDDWIKTPFDDYNDRINFKQLIEGYGWTFVQSRGAKDFYRRPGSESFQSGNWDHDRKWFTAFSTSAGLDTQKAYRACYIYAEFSHGGDYKAAVKQLIADGYGVKQQEKSIKVVKDLSGIISDSDRDHEQIEKFVRGEIPKGLLTGDPALDEYYRYKKNFVVMNGHSNVGKSTLSWFMLAVAAFRHDWSICICTTEVMSEWCRLALYQFICGKYIDRTSASERKWAKEWVDSRFRIIRGSEFDFTYKTFLDNAANIYNKQKFDAILLDPYNSLLRESGASNGDHGYDYEAVSAFRRFSTDFKAAFWLNVHTTTESVKRKDKEGYFLPPDAADSEGGNKFVARSDDFLTNHRLTNHPTEYMSTQVHVRKIKETITGGKPTKKDSPIIWQYSDGGFVNRDSRINPMTFDYACLGSSNDFTI